MVFQTSDPVAGVVAVTRVRRSVVVWQTKKASTLFVVRDWLFANNF